MNSTGFYGVARWKKALSASLTILALVASSAGSLFAFPQQAYALDTGLKSPTTAVTPNDWNDPLNAVSSNDIYAVGQDDTSGSPQDDQGYGSFVFGIPSGATIDGIEVRVEAKGEKANECKLNVDIASKSGVDSQSQTITSTTTDNIYTFGGSADLWSPNSPWASTDFADGTFKLELEVDDISGDSCNDSGSEDVLIDHVQVKVYYTEAALPPDYSISGSVSSIVGTLVNLSGLSGANPQTGADGTQHMAVDWDEDQDGDPETGTGWEVENLGGLVFTPEFTGSNPNRNFTDSWTATNDYSGFGGGTYNISVMVYHGNTPGEDGSASAILNLEVFVPINEIPSITLLGDDPLELIVGDLYSDPGATASDTEDGDITGDIVVAGDVVDTNTVGSYVVTYNVTDSDGGVAVEVTRTVNVNPVPTQCNDGIDNDGDDLIDLADSGCTNSEDNDENTPPIITLTGNAVVDVTVGDSYVDAGSTADDVEDGDITPSIVVGGDTVDTNTVGSYVITYNVSDSDSASASEVTRTVNVNPVVTQCNDGIDNDGDDFIDLNDTGCESSEDNDENNPPLITLLGDAVINLILGAFYSESGATADDLEDGDITPSIVVGGDTVDTNTVGSYVITYNVSDSDSAPATEVTRTVNVAEPATGSLVIYKYTDYEDGSFDFDVSDGDTMVATPTVITNAGEGTSTAISLLAGASYSVVEDTSEGWFYDDESSYCEYTTGEGEVSTLTNGFSFSVEEDDAISCYFYNTLDTSCDEGFHYDFEEGMCVADQNESYSDLSISKVVDDTTPDAGQQITYTLTLTNNGPHEAGNIEVVDVLPAGLTYVSHDAFSGTFATSTGTWSLLSLGNSASTTLAIVVTVDEETEGQSIINIASISTTDSIDENSENDSQQVEITVENAPVYQCSDGQDNDGDGNTDYGFDPSCTSPTDNDESDNPNGGGGGGGPLGGGITDLGGGNGQVLGASTEGQVLGESCGLFMDQYLRRGNTKNRADQVAKLQEFLIKHGYGAFAPTGFFGPLTEDAVKAFQSAYAQNVLAPWGLSQPTGLAYLTTLRQLNLIECPDLSLTVPELVEWSKNPQVAGFVAGATFTETENITTPPSSTDESNTEESEEDEPLTEVDATSNEDASNGQKGFWRNFLKGIFGR